MPRRRGDSLSRHLETNALCRIRNARRSGYARVAAGRVGGRDTMAVRSSTSSTRSRWLSGSSCRLDGLTQIRMVGMTVRAFVKAATLPTLSNLAHNFASPACRASTPRSMQCPGCWILNSSRGTALRCRPRAGSSPGVLALLTRSSPWSRATVLATYSSSSSSSSLCRARTCLLNSS
jgi:hypothetical protein